MMRMIFEIINKIHLTNKRAYFKSTFVEDSVNAVLSIVFPVFAYYAIFGGTVSTAFESYTETTDYIGYIVIGQATNVFVFSLLLSIGVSLIDEVFEGTYNNYIISPMPSMVYFIGTFIAHIPKATIQCIIIFAMGILMGFSIPLNKIPALLCFLFILVCSCFCMALLFTSIILHFRDTYLTESTLSYAIGVFCGVYFPTQYLPYLMQHISNLFPLTYVLRIIRQLMFTDLALPEIGNELLIATGLSGMYFVIGFIWYVKIIEQKIVQNMAI